ncbi:MAG: hypothetical protein D6784_08125 [Chloroflexi bacterium]|nr:MAG: hypothetical protein D6784_08125 [Chloroflexota bacterium]
MMTRRTLFLLFWLWILLTPACSVPGTAGPTAPPAPSPAADSPPRPDGLETVVVSSVLDGDTIQLADGRKVRYIGINTPERGQPFYSEATEANRRLIADRTIRLERDVESFDQYGRILAYVWADDVLVNLEIVRQGYANTLTIPPNVKYESLFRQAEREAREAGRGLWAAAPVALKITGLKANAPGKDNENPNGEWVEITNQGQEAVQMRGFTLKDEANHIYTFGDFVLLPGEKVRLYSGTGQDTSTALYWGLVNESVWNNDSDTAFLRDAQGNLVDMYAY